MRETGEALQAVAQPLHRAKGKGRRQRGEDPRRSDQTQPISHTALGSVPNPCPFHTSVKLFRRLPEPPGPGGPTIHTLEESGVRSQNPRHFPACGVNEVWWQGLFRKQNSKSSPVSHPSVLPAMENRGQKESQCGGPVPYSSLVPAQRPASSVCVPGCSPLLCCYTQAPAWSLHLESPWPQVKPHGYGGRTHECTEQVRVT